MRRLIHALQAFFPFSSPEPRTHYERQLQKFVRKQLGGRRIHHLNLYKQAMTHRSCEQSRTNRFAHINERLEYLGDAVLSLCVAELLFKAYPSAEEGMLTSMRSKIVNTAQLAYLSEQIGLPELLRYRGDARSQNVVGSALEAFVGAVYLDQGYVFCRYFVHRRLIAAHISLEELRKKTLNYKGKIVEWAQQQKKQLQFKVIRIQGAPPDKKFQSSLYLEDKMIAEAVASSKKEAQQLSSKLACAQLDLPYTSELCQ